jgi:hypothetical protein
MRSFFARCSHFAALLPVLALLSCSDNSSSPTPEPEPDHLTRQTAHTTSGIIGPAGGSLHTTANDGTVYTLTIPANAIPTGRTITMTPITAIDGYPLAGGVVGGVELKPSGTVFTVPVTLKIETTKTPDAGSVPLAILFSGNGTSFQPSFVGSGAGTFTVPMTHFSGGSVGFATAQELERLATSGAALCLDPGIQMAADNNLTALFALYRSCFQSDVLPALEGATTDVQLATAIGQFTMWKKDSRDALGPALFATFDDAAETSQYFDALVGKLQAAVDRNNQKCEQDESLAALANVLFWQTQAARFGLDTVANLLARDTVLLGLCAHPVVESLVIPADIQVGFPHSIDITFGLLFDTHQDPQGVPFEVHLVGDGVDIQHPTGFTDTQGKYTTVITATREGEVFIDATACVIYPGTQTASDLCVEGTGTTSAINLNGTWSGTVDVGSSPVCAIINQNQNAITGTIHQFGGTATLLATLSGSQLLGVTVDGFFVEANCTATGTGSVSGDTFTITVTAEAPCNTNASLTYSFTRGSCP